MKRIKPAKPRRMVMNMTPMIDIVFQLLIFLMVVSQFVEQSIEEVQLPLADQSEEQEAVPPLVISIRLSKEASTASEPGSRAQVIINGQEYSIEKKPSGSIPTLKSFLASYVESLGSREPEVQLRADARAHYRFVQKVVYTISRAEISLMSFAIQGEEE